MVGKDSQLYFFNTGAFLVLLIFTLFACTRHNKDQTVSNKAIEKDSLVEVLQQDINAIDYSNLISKFPQRASLNIGEDQLQKSRYTKYSPERELNNYYFELEEFEPGDKDIIQIESKLDCRLFFFGRKKFDSHTLVVTLVNDTVSEGINDIYIAQLLDNNNILKKTFELASINSPFVEESTEKTALFDETNIIRSEIFESYASPIEDDLIERTLKIDTINFLD